MLRFMNSWFGQTANPIGVDFGSDTLKLAQVQMNGAEPHLIAAACADVPSHVRHDPAGRVAFFVQTTRDLLAQGNFRGRSAVLSLPAAWMFIQHLRLPRLDEEETRKALPWEARGKLPIDPTHAILRHLVAGEVYQDQEPKNEIILMAAAREGVTQFLEAAAKAKLDVIGMNVEPSAIVNCFAHVYRRKTDDEVTNCFVDIGASGTRAFVSRAGQIHFARAIPVGGEHFTRAVANHMKMGNEDAKLLRLRLASIAPPATERQEKHDLNPAAAKVEDENSFALLGAGMSAAEKRENERRAAPAAAATTAMIEAPAPAHPDIAHQAREVELACQQPLAKLVEELDLCRRYYEATFPNKPVDRLIFVGGEARNRALCTAIAEQMGLAAQVGDPLVRMGRTSEVGIESGIDRRQPQPAWTVAIGLSLGPVGAAAGRAK